MKKIKLLLLLLLSILCMMLSLCACSKSKQEQTSADADKTINKVEEMKKNLNSAVSDMLTAASYAESILNANVSLWNPYDNGEMIYVQLVYENDATWNASKDSVYYESQKNTIEEARKNLKSLNSAHSKFSSSNEKMIHWPDEMKEEKEIYDALYDAYLNLYNLSTSPSGNYTNYSKNVTLYISEFVTQYEKIKRYL